MYSGRLLYNLLNIPSSVVKRSLTANMTTWQEQKRIIGNMSLAEKRKLYVNYVTLDRIEVWAKRVLSEPPSLARDREIYETGKFRRRQELDKVLAGKISIWKGDITRLEIDAIVNAADSKLLGGAGVDGAIHHAAGEYLKEECRQFKHCPTGEAKITSGHKLPAKFVIHTVGPRDKSRIALENCYKNSFQLVKENGIKSVAFPCIATGVYRFPNLAAAHIALAETRKFLENDYLEEGGKIERVIFCVFEAKDEAIYRSAAQIYFANV